MVLLLLKWIWQLSVFINGFFLVKQVFLALCFLWFTPKIPKNQFYFALWHYGSTNAYNNSTKENSTKKRCLLTYAADPVPPRAWPRGGPSPGAALPLGVAGARLGAPVALGVGKAGDWKINYFFLKFELFLSQLAYRTIWNIDTGKGGKRRTVNFKGIYIPDRQTDQERVLDIFFLIFPVIRAYSVDLAIFALKTFCKKGTRRR